MNICWVSAFVASLAAAAAAAACWFIPDYFQLFQIYFHPRKKRKKNEEHFYVALAKSRLCKVILLRMIINPLRKKGKKKYKKK